ncbi:hypothetical protein J2857_003106 [Neorhizobium galegae]|uniref:hypothetical protein n=1 Tax=Neorhizobium galegae TaxID=399 RepID=UPI001AE590A8|nr:hypothetical protein [Neorhizobium galegae]MBP2560337.1 hypothetical protein [Neorhizobium galegae]
MNSHVSIETAEAIEEPFRFTVGQAVEHRSGWMRSVIADRQRTGSGGEVYGVYVIPEDAAGRPFRVIFGQGLVARQATPISSLFDSYRIFKAAMEDNVTERDSQEVEYVCGRFFETQVRITESHATDIDDLVIKLQVWRDVVETPDDEVDYSEPLALLMSEIQRTTAFRRIR